MRRLPDVDADVDDLATWTKYRKSLCDHCSASCCRLPVELQPSDLVRLGLMDEFELE